jgi:hypothetical protein
MTIVKEKFGTGYLDEEGDVKPYADIQTDVDAPVPDNAFITQGIGNLEAVRANADSVALIEAIAEADARIMREQKVAEEGLRSAGVFVTLEEHRANQVKIADIASGISMYKGGEKGGFKTDDFNQRYGFAAADVVRGALVNHRKLVNRELPSVYKAYELKAVGFEADDVDHDAKTTMRSEIMSRLGGPEKKKARARHRARYSS